MNERLSQQPVGRLAVTDFTGSPVNQLQCVIEMGQKLGIGVELSDGPLLFGRDCKIECVNGMTPKGQIR